MLAQMRCSLPILCVVLLGILPANGAEPSFADLLARAQAQAAAGHRWSPPGDNFVETVVTLFSRLPTATRNEVVEFTALIEHDQKAMHEQPGQLQPVENLPDARVDPVVPPPVASSAPDAREDQAVPPPVASSAPDAREDPAVPPAVASVAPDARVDPVVSPPVASLAPDARVDSAISPPVVPPAVASIAPDARVNPAVPPPVASIATAPPAPLSVLPPIAVPTQPPIPTTPVSPAVPDARTVDLYSRGQAAERRGDISGARRFYAAAAQHGFAPAARSAGRLYDPDYLHRNVVGGIDADAATARRWYERATALGDPEAGPLLQALSSR